ncbi:hypothetical protein BJX61DRAFT_539179 [Aspergillus egyptiacus]|nr:hypothetical protein BJX61DRAFT_539179 [Aspergillus egyptiacus]
MAKPPTQSQTSQGCPEASGKGAFSGAFSPELENSIVRDLVQGIQFDTEGLDSESQTAILDDIVWRLDKQVQTLIGSRVETARSQNGCWILELRPQGLFGPFQDSPGQSRSACVRSLTREHPLYLMSFVCRPDSYTTPEVHTKFDVPNGLTEAYLLEFNVRKA